MAETPLEKVLRLAGGITRTYIRNENGRPVTVHQYVTPRRAASAVAQPAMPAPVAPGASRQESTAFGALRRGQVVQVAAQRFRVMQVNAATPSPGSGHYGVGGSGLTTGSGGPISHGRVTNRMGGKGFHPAPITSRAQLQGRNPADILLGGKAIPKGTPVVTSVLADMSSGQHWYVTLPASFSLRVVG